MGQSSIYGLLRSRVCSVATALMTVLAVPVAPVLADVGRSAGRIGREGR